MGKTKRLNYIFLRGMLWKIIINFGVKNIKIIMEIPTPEYGGKLTDLRELPVGTKFFVTNGWWEGEILSDNRILVHAPTDDIVVKLTDKYHSLYLWR